MNLIIALDRHLKALTVIIITEVAALYKCNGSLLQGLATALWVINILHYLVYRIS